MTGRAIVLSTVSALACGDEPRDEGDLGPLDCGDPCVLEDDQNFRYSATLEVDVVPLQEFSDATIDWSGLTVDVQGHAVDPTTEIDQVRLVAFANRTPEYVMEGLANDSLEQSDVAVYLTCDAEGRTSCLLSEFSILGSTPGVDEYFEEGIAAWLLAAQTFEVQGARGLLFVEPLAASTDDAAYITSETASLDAAVDLTSAGSIGLATEPSVTVDWGSLTKNGLGNEMSIHRIDRIEVGRYDLSPAELEESFLDIEILALDRYQADVSGLTASPLTTLTSLADGSAFTGIDGDSTWLLALRCSTCDNPVPRFMAVVEPPR